MKQRKWTVVLLYPYIEDAEEVYIAHVEGETWVGAEWKARVKRPKPFTSTTTMISSPLRSL